MSTLADQILAVHKRRGFLDRSEYIELLDVANAALEGEDPAIRPRDSGDQGGGLVYLDTSLPTILLPDLHGRIELLSALLLSPVWRGLERLDAGELQIVCVGDGFHGEARAYDRWRKAHEEYTNGYRRHQAMDEEMIESLGVMEIVMRVKATYPDLFHFLKGNHENVSNEHGGGNYPFRKFVDEGAMVADYLAKFFGEDFLRAYYRFEKNFPLVAVGNRFLVSHGEPLEAYSVAEVIEYRSEGDVVSGLTWTDNDQADPGSVQEMLDLYLPEGRREGALYFGGHRPVPDLFRLRSEGNYVQFHNPDRYVVAVLAPDRAPDPDRDVHEVDVTVLDDGVSGG